VFFSFNDTPPTEIYTLSPTRRSSDLLTGAGEPARVSVTSVTTGFFSMLGVAAVLGRTFLADEGKQGQEHVALLSEALWRNRFGRSEEHTSELQSRGHLVCRLLLEKKK